MIKCFKIDLWIDYTKQLYYALLEGILLCQHMWRGFVTKTWVWWSPIWELEAPADAWPQITIVTEANHFILFYTYTSSIIVFLLFIMILTFGTLHIISCLSYHILCYLVRSGWVTCSCRCSHVLSTKLDTLVTMNICYHDRHCQPKQIDSLQLLNF